MRGNAPLEVTEMVPHADLDTDRRHPHPNVEPTRPEQWYDRSSIKADALVMIEGQTEEEFFLHAPENRYCEFIDGVVYMPSPVTERHQDLVGFWFVILAGVRRRRGIGKVMMGPCVLRVAPGRDLEPDVFVAPVGERALPPAGLAFGAAELVVEVLSSGNRSHDLRRKAEVCREAKVPEIVFVDDRDKMLIVDRLAGDAYETIQVGSGRWESSALPGYWLDVEWLWGDPLPDPFHCLEAILAG
jgi:Uma2 family endonuclease